MLYNTADCLRCLTILFSMILTDFIMWNKENDELVFFNPYPFNQEIDQKLRFILRVFLPVNYKYIIHWQYTYGIIDQAEKMITDAFVL